MVPKNLKIFETESENQQKVVAIIDGQDFRHEHHNIKIFHLLRRKTLQI